MRYTYSVMPLAEGEFEARATDIVAQARRGVFHMPLFCMTLTPEGDPVRDKVSAMAELYARYRDRLAADGVEAGILVQASLGHGYPIAKNPFVPYVNLTDGEPQFACCPLDDEFLKHFSDVLRSLAREKPRVIMLDDDFRLMMRPGRGCACPLHMAEFNRRAGTNLRREELFEHIQAYGKTDRLKRIFEETQRDALIQAATAFRGAIDEIDPTIQGINCTSGQICESVSFTNKIFAGKGNPTIVRIPNGSYAPLSVRGFSRAMCQTAICASKLKKQGIEILLAETDTIPFNRYAKSARYLHPHFVASLLDGLKGAKHWLTRLGAYEPRSGEAYREILAKHKGMYERIAALSDGIRWFGASSAYVEQTEVDFHAKSMGRYHDHFWVEKHLERMGIPFYFSENAEAASFLEGNLVADMTDAQIQALLTGSVFLDGASAAQLCARGYGAALGVTVEPWDLAPVWGETFDGTPEQCCSPQKNYRKITVTDPNTQALSYLCFEENGNATLAAPAVTVLEREGGKLSVVFCGSPDVEFNYGEGFSFLNESRKAQFVSLLRRANALPMVCVGDDEICLRGGYLPNGQILAAVFLLGLDPMEDLRIRLETIKKLAPMRISHWRQLFLLLQSLFHLQLIQLQDPGAVQDDHEGAHVM